MLAGVGRRSHRVEQHTGQPGREAWIDEPHGDVEDGECGQLGDATAEPGQPVGDRGGPSCTARSLS